MNVTLGISTAFAVKRWPDPETYLYIIKNKLDLKVIQFSFDLFDPRGKGEAVEAYCRRLRKAARDLGINIHSTFTGLSIYPHNLLYHPLIEGRLDGLDWWERAIDMTAKLEVKTIGGPFGGLSVNSYRNDAERAYLGQWAEEALLYLLHKAGNLGIKEFCWEPTPIRREGPVTIEETRNFVRKINSMASAGSAELTLCLDTGHATNPEVKERDRDPYAWIENLGHEATMIHLQQTDGYLDRHWPFTPEKNAMGIIHGDKIVDSLFKSHCKNIILIIEVNHPFEEDDDRVLHEVYQSVDYWRQVLKRHNLI